MENNFELAIQRLEAELSAHELKANGLRFAIETLRTSSTSISDPVDANIKQQNSVNSNVSDLVIIDDILSPDERVSIVYEAISHLNRFSKINDIILEIKGRLTNVEVRTAITILFAENKITKVQVTTSYLDTFWGLGKWIDQNNKIKEDHLYDKKKVVGRKFKEAA